MQTTFTVPDLACAACVATIDRAVRAVDPQAKVTANPQTKLVEIESELPVARLSATITDAGYTVSN